MAHQIQTMAYVGETPWHHLGNALPAQRPLSEWAVAPMATQIPPGMATPNSPT